jgi:hypothetical protein
MVLKRLACDVALAIADWLRISFAVFLSSETLSLTGLRSPGEFKYYAFERFRSILHMTMKNSLKTQSPIPGIYHSYHRCWCASLLLPVGGVSGRTDPEPIKDKARLRRSV